MRTISPFIMLFKIVWFDKHFHTRNYWDYSTKSISEKNSVHQYDALLDALMSQQGFKDGFLFVHVRE